MGTPTHPALLRHDQHTAMARLADDVYDSAAGIGQPPSGWIRASDNLDELRDRYPHLALSDDQRLRNLFAPDKLGVRAELYLPDPRVQPSGTLPVLAFKGTNGEIRVQDPSAPGGVRRVESAISDWANNLIQGTGGESPDYTHAMAMARTLQRGGVEFQVTGHSKGGGLATAVAAVTGSEAAVFNPAGVHPETTARFLRHDTTATRGDASQLVTTYKVAGEVLNAGAQDFTAGMSERSKQQLAGVIQEVARTSRTVPGFDEQILGALRAASVDDVSAQRTLEAVHHLGGPNTRQLLEQFPTAGGRVEPTLRAMERRPDGELVERQGRTLPEAAPALSPVLGALHDIAEAARKGRNAGVAAQNGVDLAARGVDGAGNVVRAGTETGVTVIDRGAQVAGATTGATIRGGGEVIATGRRVAGEMDGAAIEGRGIVISGFQQVGAERARQLAAIPFMPDYAQRWLNRSADQLEQGATSTLVEAQRKALAAREQSRSDAAAIRQNANALAGDAATVVARSTDGAERGLRDLGAGTDRRLDGAARSMRDGAAYLPAAVAGTAAAVETVRQSLRNPTLPGAAIETLKQAQDAAGESVHRHGMGVVIDSLDQRRLEIERATRERATPDPTSTSPAPPPRDPADRSHPRHAMFRSIEDGVHAIDARLGRTPDAASRNLSYALYAEARGAGWNEVGGVVMSGKTERLPAGEQAFAYRGTPERAEGWVSVRTAQAVQTPPEASLARTEKVELALQRDVLQRSAPEPPRGPTMA
jgi:hypothetical protein